MREYPEEIKGENPLFGSIKTQSDKIHCKDITWNIIALEGRLTPLSSLQLICSVLSSSSSAIQSNLEANHLSLIAICSPCYKNVHISF